mgnify:CR=1 FL=1
MFVIKVISTVLIAVLMLIFFCIWVSTAEEKQYTWIWVLIESVYVLSVISIWGSTTHYLKVMGL